MAQAVSPIPYTSFITSYANYTLDQCFALPDAQEVACVEQQLNVTDPPSIYSFTEYNALWEPISCYLWNVTLGHRIDVAGTFNYCSVPLRGYDAFLFVALALLAAAALFGKLSAVWALVAGGVLGLINYYANLLQISNAISLWLSIQPADLFLYAFLPPLLVETAIRIDFFVLSKIWVHALLLAFVMVILFALALTPFILFGLGFQNRGWSWVDGALFSAIISPTDALSVAAILSRANGPERLVALMEGESLFNDASALTLFEVFSGIVYSHIYQRPPIWPSVWSVIPEILLDIVRLSAIGAGIGLGMSWATGYLLQWLRWRGARPYMETTVVLAVAYLAYYVTNAPANGSGVIAVVCFGLYGNGTSKWGMLGSAEEIDDFDKAWDFISFVANGLVFFWSGVASINYFIRSVTLLTRTAWSYAAIPLIWLFMLVIRTLCIWMFNPVFKVLGEGLSFAEILFVGWCGLRGSISLILVSAFTTGSRLSYVDTQTATEITLVNADISLWTSSFVLMTLLVNGPLVAPLLKLLRLNRLPAEKLKMRTRAKRALGRFTNAQIAAMREDEDEFLQGADWEAVGRYVDLSKRLSAFDDMSLAVGGGKVENEGSNSRSAGNNDDDDDDNDDDVKTVGQVARALWRALLNTSRKFVFACCRRPFHQAQVLDVSKSLEKRRLGKFPQTRLRQLHFPPRPSGGGGGQGEDEDLEAPINEVSSIDFIPFVGTEGTEEETEGSSQERQEEERVGLGTGPAAEPVQDSSLPSPSQKEQTPSRTHQPAGDQPKREKQQHIGRHNEKSVAWGDLTAKEIAQEMGKECPFYVKGREGREGEHWTNDPSRKGNSEQGPTESSVSHHRPHSTGKKQAADGEPGVDVDVELGLAVQEQNDHQPNNMSSLMPIQEGRQLSSTALQPPPSDTTGKEDSKNKSESAQEDENYYFSLPINVRQAIRDQLQTEMTEQQEDQSPIKPAAGARAYTDTDLEADATKSMPATVGSTVIDELRRRLAQESEADAASKPDTTARGKEKKEMKEEHVPAIATIPSPFEQGIKSVDHASTSSMPAAVGGRMKAELQSRLGKASQIKQKGGQATRRHQDEVENDSNAKRSHKDVAEWESYLSTVSGVMGANLQAELRQHLRGAAVRKAAASDSGWQSKDLLGRRVMMRDYDGGAMHKHKAAPYSSVVPTPTPMATALLDMRYPRDSDSLPQQKSSNEDSMRPVGRKPRRSVSELPAGIRSSAHYHRAVDTVRPSPASQAQALLLTRTFSLGASLADRTTLQESLHEGDEEDQDVAEGTGQRRDGSASTTVDRQYQLKRTVSVTTVREEGQRDQDRRGQGGGGSASGQAAMLSERRIRLLAGIKRHLVGKRHAGMLSVEGLRILQYACDRAVDHAECPLSLWASLEREVSGGWTTRAVSRLSLSTTRLYRAMSPFFQRLFSWPFKQFAGLLRRHLGRKMLVACEVAVEYYLALLGSPQVQWLRSHGEACGRLMEEIEAESDAAHRFIIEREIEAPDRFQAIQSYRSAMAILKQQHQFVDELYEMGMVDEAEHREMMEPIDAKIRQLEITGPIWRPPRPRTVLRSLPFMERLSESSFRQVWDGGALKEFGRGVCIWNASDLVRKSGGILGPGGFVVLSGVVKRIYIRPNGERKEYFQGSGGVVGVLLCMTGSKLPGTELAIAQGNALGKGPLVFHVPQSAVARIIDESAAGNVEMQELEEDLLRLSAAYVVESMNVEEVEEEEVEEDTENAEAGHLFSSNVVEGDGKNINAESDENEEEDEIFEAPLRSTSFREVGGGKGLVSSKSVAANLASIKQHIADIEFEDEEEEEEGEEEELEEGRREEGGHGEDRGGDGQDNRGGPEVDESGTHDRTVQRRRRTDHSRPMKARRIKANVAADIRRGLHSSLVYKLPPRSRFSQTTHMVLLAGSIIVDSDTVGSSQGNVHGGEAPLVLPWWYSSEENAETRRWVVGRSGATIVVCRHPDGSLPKMGLPVDDASRDDRGQLTSFPLPLKQTSNSRRVTAENNNDASYSESEQGSFVGNAAAALSREFSSVLRRLRRATSEAS